MSTLIDHLLWTTFAVSLCLTSSGGHHRLMQFKLMHIPKCIDINSQLSLRNTSSTLNSFDQTNSSARFRFGNCWCVGFTSVPSSSEKKKESQEWRNNTTVWSCYISSMKRIIFEVILPERANERTESERVCFCYLS